MVMVVGVVIVLVAMGVLGTVVLAGVVTVLVVV